MARRRPAGRNALEVCDLNRVMTKGQGHHEIDAALGLGVEQARADLGAGRAAALGAVGATDKGKGGKQSDPRTRRERGDAPTQ